MEKHYLHHLYRDISDGWLSVFNGATKKTVWFEINRLDDAIAYMQGVSVANDVYHSFHVYGQRPDRGRGGADMVSVLPGFFLDPDLKSPVAGVHKRNDELPESLEEVLGYLEEAGFPKPTAIRFSGNGNYLDYLFEKPLVLTTAEERKQARDLSQAFQAVFIALLKSKGRHLDTVGDLPRITRMPGTLNHKTDPAKAVELVEFHEDRRYPLEEIRAFVEAHTPKKAPKGKSRRRRKKQQENLEPTLPSLDAVRAGCAWVDWAMENAAELGENDWFALAGITKFCENGEELFHQNSQVYDRYNPEEAHGRLDRNEKPRSCGFIAGNLGFEGCKSCPFYGQEGFTTPVQLGHLNPDVAGLMRENVYDYVGERYLDVETGRSLSASSFSGKHHHLTGQPTPHSVLVRMRFTRKVELGDYRPGDSRLYLTDEKGREVFNLWRPGGVEPLEGDASVIWEHLAYIVQSPKELAHFVDALAHAVQKPQEKIHHVLLLIGKQGTGKSFFGQLFKQLFGPDNVFVAESSDLTDGWTAQMGNRQGLVIEELGVFERREAFENLKTWITEDTVTVNEKHVKKYSARTPRVMLAISNHATPISLGGGDRRYFVLNSKAEPKDGAYYKQLFTVGLDQAPAFLADLLKRDISHFNPAVTPPMTDAKAEILKWSQPVVQQEVQAMMDELDSPFWRDFLTVEDVREAIANRMKGRFPGIREVTDALKALGCEYLRQVRFGTALKRRVWVWRNIDRWKVATTQQLRDGLLMPILLDAAE
ncbi:primase-helicase family protein [Faunimonas sp. B44]|uniref:primase-helicase family protein n=1 Tax=Faunimonas sp. B44 TaxID=3461493 RepID=UPI0040448840